MANGFHTPPEPPAAILRRYKNPLLGTIIKNKIRGLTFGQMQFVDAAQESIFGPARETQIGTQQQSLGLGRPALGGSVGRRLKEKAALGGQLSRSRQTRTKPGFASRDVRKLNVGGPGKASRGPRIN
jgi:hypothetical protein